MATSSPSKAWFVRKTNEMTWAHIERDLPKDAWSTMAKELDTAREIVFGNPKYAEDLEKQRKAEKILNNICLWYHIWID